MRAIVRVCRECGTIGTHGVKCPECSSEPLAAKVTPGANPGVIRRKVKNVRYEAPVQHNVMNMGDVAFVVPNDEPSVTVYRESFDSKILNWTFTALGIAGTLVMGLAIAFLVTVIIIVAIK